MALRLRYFLPYIPGWIKLIFRISLIILVIMLAISPRRGLAQSVESTYSKTLFSSNDSFTVRFSMLDGKFSFKISGEDTLDMGSDGALGLNASIYFGNDSLIFKYQNLPYAQSHWIHFESSKGKTVYHLHFNPVTAEFSAKYMEKYNHSVQVEIPEVYELANIIWLLSPSGQRAKNLNKQGEYYQRVMNYFHPYLNHPIFKNLDFPPDDFGSYYNFRENSFCFHYNKSKLIYSGPYYYVEGNDWNNFNSLFKKLLPLIQDFSDKSNFERFYKSNSKYYASEILLEEKRMPVKKMWLWLEDKFPDEKYNSYKVVFSPLIGGSHSTQNFSEAYGRKFKETVMFVTGPGIFDNDKSLKEEEKTGMLSGVVFTEIDHNYVNPVSARYGKQIDSIFSEREFWTSPGGDTEFYDSPMSVFNEYMTHSVFCLYVLDNFDSVTADFVIKKREALMVNRRGYSRFREFNKELIKIYEENPKSDLPSIFPKILSWCETQQR